MPPDSYSSCKGYDDLEPFIFVLEGVWVRLRVTKAACALFTLACRKAVFGGMGSSQSDHMHLVCPFHSSCVWALSSADNFIMNDHRAHTSLY